MSTEVKSARKRAGRPAFLTDSARKRKKLALDIKRSKTRVSVGDQFDRWNNLKQRLGLKSHPDVAKVLLDSYETVSTDAYKATTSTPAFKPKRYQALMESLQNVSEISSADSADSVGMASDVSGVQVLGSDNENDQKDSTERQQGEISSIFLNPFELSVEVSEEDISCDTDNGDSDEDYEPSINITLGPRNARYIQDVSFAEAEFGDQSTDSDDEVAEAAEVDVTEPGLRRILSTDKQSEVTDDEAYIVYLNCLLTLAQVHIPGLCQEEKCNMPVNIYAESVGSALYLKWICHNDHHIYSWCSQPILNRRLHSGDLLSAAAILLSGNNYSKIALFSRFLKLHFLSSSVFLKIQRTYLVPAVENFWEERQAQVLEEFRDKQLVVLGDGRMDSPGHCAQYCSYTMMENTTKKIISLETMDKRQVAGKSSNLEKACLVKSIHDLSEKGVAIAEIVTDQHLQITSLMKKDHPRIKHSYDLWHVAKNIGKKIIKAGKDKSCKDLLPWTQHIVNHFWHACNRHDNGEVKTYTEFMGIWCGVLHHVIDEHEWLFNYGSGSNRCSHGPLVGERETTWLKKGSKAHQALVKIVMDRRLQNNAAYYLNCRQTGELENYQNHILMYAAKRFAYSPPVYRARNLLAALDYNEHVERGPLINKDGSQRYQRLFNKKSGRWSVTEVKKTKTYLHIPQLISSIVSMRLEDPEGMQKRVTLKADDPRLISKTLAPVPPPATSQLALEKKCRLKKEEN